MAKKTKKPNFSLFSYDTTWTKTITSEGYENTIYNACKTNKSIDYYVSENTFRVKNSSNECLNPLSALVELASEVQDDQRKNAEHIVQQYFKRFGFFSAEEQITFTQNDLEKIVKHYKLLLNIMQQYYTEDENYVTLFSNCVEYLLIHAKIARGMNATEVDPEDDYFHTLFKSFSYWLHYDQFDWIKKVEKERKCERTKIFFEHSMRLTRNKTNVQSHALTLEDYQAEKDQEENDTNFYRQNMKKVRESILAKTGIDLETKKNEPSEMLLLIGSISNRIPFYIERGSVHFANKENANEELLPYKSNILSFAREVIMHSIGNMDLNMAFDVDDSKSFIVIDNLISLMDYSLIILAHKDYGYYPCSNPKCRKYVLRHHPSYKKNESSDDVKQSHYCSKKCAKRQAQRDYMSRQKI